MRFLLLLALVVLIGSACSDEPAETTPEVALDAPAFVAPAWLGTQPQNAHAYSDETLARLRKLVEGDDWRDPAWSEQGMVEVIHEKTGLAFVLIPAGSFDMGSPVHEEFHEFDEEQRRVVVRAFLIGKTECTQDAWIKGGGGSISDPGSADRPAKRVNWSACREWCEKLGLRLPTEAEWEYACRGGTTTAYWSGDDESDLARVAWYADSEDSGYRTHAVGEKAAPNPWGLHDVHGNVWEWCEDLYESGSGERVLRGGSWFDDAEDCRSAFRYADDPDGEGLNAGLRPAASLPE